MRSERRLLVVDDDPDMCEALTGLLHGGGYDHVDATTSAEQCLSWMEATEYTCVLVDIELAHGESGLALCTRIAEARPDIPVIIVTVHSNAEAAIGAIRSGAYDFVTKPVSKDVLDRVVARAVEYKELGDQSVRLLQEVSDSSIAELIGASAPMRALGNLIRRVARTDISVLVTGESGTGKELVAKAIHARSGRASHPFVAINCAAMPAALLESELFGHTRGAFTDANRPRQGLLVQADGGTLFLDEIGEMSLDLQAKLLRALQDKQVRAVGGERATSVDTRIIAATNRDLDADVEAGRFRADLFYRLDVVRVDVPPLRAHGTDILALAYHFLDRYTSNGKRSIRAISSSAERALLEHSWPGNVRELENAVECAVALTRADEIQPEDLPAAVRQHRSTRMVIDGQDVDSLPTLGDFERRYINRVLEAVKGNKTQASRVLGMNRRTLHRRLRDLESSS